MSSKITPFFHPTLLSRAKELLERATGSPSKADGGSWMSRKIPPRPTLDSLWTTLEGRFSSFVAGDSEDGGAGKAAVSVADGTTGPFATFSVISEESVGGSSGTSSGNKDSGFAKSQSQPDLRRASESHAAPPPPVPRMPPNIPPAKALSLPPGPPPPQAPAPLPRQPPKSTVSVGPPVVAKRGHAHKRSQSMGFLAYGSDPYASAPSWAPPPTQGSLMEEEESGKAEEDEEAEPETPQAAPQSNGWWGAAGYSAAPGHSALDAPSRGDDMGGGNFISPMGSTSASPASFAAPATSQQGTTAEDEELEDLGFGNASTQRSRQQRQQTTDAGHQRASSEGTTPANPPPSGDSKPTPAQGELMKIPVSFSDLHSQVFFSMTLTCLDLLSRLEIVRVLKLLGSAVPERGHGQSWTCEGQVGRGHVYGVRS